VVEKKQPISDAVDILHRRYYEGKPDRLASLEEERINAEIAQAIYDLRTQAGLSQRDLATLVGTSASAICRLEDADYEGHSLAMLRRIAAALGQQVELRFVSAQGTPAAAIVRVHDVDESQALAQAGKRYTQALLATLQALGVQQKDIAKKLQVSQQLISDWTRGTYLAHPTHERKLHTLLGTAATEAHQQAYDIATAQAVGEKLLKAIIDLDGAILEMEKAYSQSARASNKAALEAIESKLGFYAVEPVTRTRLEQTRHTVYAAMDDLQNIWPEAKARNRALKALLDAAPTTQEEMPAYLNSMLDLLMKAFGKPDAGALQRKRGKRTVQRT
jgi:transcriptional regulator with XRE-family HTH domain